MISSRRTGTEFVNAPRGVETLTLRELEALPRTLLPVLLAFLHTGVARQKTVCAQRGPQLWIELRNRARQSHAYRSGLPANAPAMRGDNHVHLLRHVREFQRLGGVMLPREVREIILDSPLVHRELAGTCAQKHTRNGFLAAAGTEKPICARDGRARRTQRSS